MQLYNPFISIRKLAALTDIPKSSVHRQINGIKKRNIYPESNLWETEKGYSWLCRFVYAIIFIFSIKSGVGATTISSFFTLIRLHHHIGVSPTTIKKIRNKMMDILIEYQDIQEKNLSRKQVLNIVAGMDETFFDDMILVLMDLPSGYILLEETSKDRTYETWVEKIQFSTKHFIFKVKYVVSDRAKALIKLAEQGFESLSIPDLFHASHEMAKIFGLSLNRKKEGIQKKIAETNAKIALSKNISQQNNYIKQLNKELLVIESGLSKYKNILHGISKAVHPFDIKSFGKQTSSKTHDLLVKIVAEARSLRIEYDITDKKNRITKFEKQIAKISSLLDAWWLWAEESLDGEKIEKEYKEWLLRFLLPFVYWQQQVSRTKNFDLKKSYQAAFEKAQSRLDQHPLTSSLLPEKKWMAWAKWMVSNFQRTSSAVEGRNGCLSQLHHAGRGLNSKRLKALTVIHNYFLKRSDGTTAAERLFKTKPPDPFEWLVYHMGDLPLPRMSNRNGEITH